MGWGDALPSSTQNAFKFNRNTRMSYARHDRDRHAKILPSLRFWRRHSRCCCCFYVRLIASAKKNETSPMWCRMDRMVYACLDSRDQVHSRAVEWTIWWMYAALLAKQIPSSKWLSKMCYDCAKVYAHQPYSMTRNRKQFCQFVKVNIFGHFFHFRLLLLLLSSRCRWARAHWRSRMSVNITNNASTLHTRTHARSSKHSLNWMNI